MVLQCVVLTCADTLSNRHLVLYGILVYRADEYAFSVCAVLLIVTDGCCLKTGSAGPARGQLLLLIIVYNYYIINSPSS